MVATTLFWSSLFSLAVAFPVSKPRVLHGARSSAPQGFSSLGNAPASQTLKLRVALTSNDISGLEQALLDVSTPSSPNYGNHLSREQVKAFMAPSDEALTAVQNWFLANNVTASSEGVGDWLTITLPVEKANSMLSANYETFLHADSGKTYARSLTYSLPAHVAPHIDVIHPTTTFNNPRTRRSVLSLPHSKRASSNDSCADTVTPACLQTLYGIPATPASNSSNNSIAVAGFIEQFAQKKDLKSFLATFRPDVSSSNTFALDTLDDGENPQDAQDAGVEALDIQYTVGLATQVPITFVSVGEDSDSDLGGFLDIVNFFAAGDTVPPVMTTSYGENEGDLTPALAIKLCNAYMALGARGTSVLFASGDGGVEGGHGQNCTTFQPAFPASCPYLTAVGSVHGTSPEIASTFSSGGFSNTFTAPDYQTDAVAMYLDHLGDTNQGLFNTSGRGFPDVSAQGENVQIVSGGQIGGVDGTSCSSPIFASVIGLLNDQLMAAGKPPLGFLNPFLYANAAAFNDVTEGSNPGCGGLGTPNFDKLKAAAGL
ncbi:subtilisin-like protein [Mycena pura]|uniref:tripeptidyl-peptidase II n=1 Tax=Mycena pura TaxID=153505 RepID=A0AAD6VIK8_9AGAR|nr:subtilisin-like protein [Mycena pura]